MQAQNLQEALANLNEQASLIFDERENIPPAASAEFYVKPKKSPSISPAYSGN